MDRTAERVRLWATTITAVAAAAAAIAGLLHYAGSTATAGLGGAVAVLVLGWVLQQALAVRRTIQAVHYHVVPNGHEGDLPEDLRGRPLREIVSGCVNRLDAGNVRFDRLEGALGEHLADHGAHARAAVTTAPRVPGEE